MLNEHHSTVITNLYFVANPIANDFKQNGCLKSLRIVNTTQLQ